MSSQASSHWQHPLASAERRAAPPQASLERLAFPQKEAAAILDPLTGEFKMGCRATGEPVAGNNRS